MIIIKRDTVRTQSYISRIKYGDYYFCLDILQHSHQRKKSLSHYISSSEAGLLRWDVAPFLDDGLLDLPRVSSGPGADLLGNIHTLLSWAQLGDQLGDVLTGPLGLQRTLLLGGVLDDSLDLVVTLLSSLLEPTPSGGAELPGLLGAAGDGGVLLHVLLGDAAHLPGPLGALGVGGVAGGLVLALLLHLSPALHHVVLHVVNLKKQRQLNSGLRAG